ncbi:MULTISPECIES: TetR/AcrR family transcriptional regulator [Mycobacterium]|uniref:Transcriptional regulator, TetR family protein n=1 Tax=Mycobacterium kiyosense TaxID=2871094 RepID=A0A9P3UVQ4_9MYCO|nr:MULTISPECIES: TetR/AcrR family transcriptional regulator [Mycobacterium]BDB42639.1 putative transcriptional regulator, TetR family protein [Mycobacterium kiyosense]BDE14102.1 putative transcriptional regulator, TetR family protein [Mycobacterium sp. 20KCMC460]GLB82935.1 putative transcriptional regulator, TetR family protein [Mycobacterium kiyosense]GLB89224.1 putative transcriptional regulator, TetR family protein [Mycobacterium kiyosense]GLB93875.1 putative transcriptional regulator, TetR
MTHPPPHPRATEQDLTAKARIRNTALDMYAQYGADRVSLRAVAAEAGVTLGLVQHHFKTKAGLRDAVDQLVVDHFALAIAEVSAHDDPAELAAARDEAVRRMLIANPVVVSYIRRSVLESSADRMHLLDVLVDLTRSEVVGLREAGLASTRRREATQVVAVLVRQLGELLLQPLVDATWERVARRGDGPTPQLSVTLRET